MKEITPKYIFVFLLAVLLSIVIISFFIPDKGIILSETMSIDAPNPLDLFKKEKVEYADISEIIENQNNISDEIEKQTEANDKKTIIDTVRADATKLKAKIQNIEFGSNAKQKLYNFFSKLENVDTLKKVIRIWHFGDSQIEGSRITGRIREKLQTEFGGYGPGFIEIDPVVDKPSWEVKASDNWQTYNLFGIIDTNVSHRKYGPLMKFFTYSSYDTTKQNKDTISKAEIEFKKTYYAQEHSERFDLFKIFYGNATQNTSLAIVDENGDTLAMKSLKATNKFSEVSFDNLSETELFRVFLKSNKSADYYTASFESETGIIMDNIALRGSAGLVFTKSNKEHLKRLFKHFDVQLIIWEFGVNMLSDETENFGFYKTRIKRQLKRFNEIAPEIPVIIIGVSDKSKKDGIYYTSLESVEKVRNAQREAALETGYMFWDMYKAMGGKNSMPSWVFADPPLASEDFTHFNHKGGEIISNMFYNSLMFEYKKYIESKENLN